MKKLIALMIGTAAFTCVFAQTVNEVKSPVDYVNPLMGTDSRPAL